MQQSKSERALSWAGNGGAVVAVAAMVTAGLVGVTPDGRSPLEAACFHGGCSAAGAGVFRPAPTRAAGPAAEPSPKAIATARRNRTGPATVVPATASISGRVAEAVVSATTPAAPPPAPRTWTAPLAGRSLAAPVVAMAAVRSGRELVMAGSDGGVFPVGEAGFYGSLSGRHLSAPVAAVAADPVTGGYWLAGSDGGVFAFHASYVGGLGSTHLAAPVVAMASTPSGDGYWLVSSDGGVFAFGDAGYFGSLSGHHLAAPVVAVLVTPTGDGYWLVSSDGGVFAFGDAGYFGSLSGRHLAAPVVAAAGTPIGDGYWLVSSDGGVFAFGDAGYVGSLPGGSSPVSAIAASADGRGYWLADRSGAVHAFGDAMSVGPAPVRSVMAASVAAGIGATAGRVLGTGTGPVVSRLTGYPAGAAGFDISQYQCDDIPSGAAGVAVVQVTGGALDYPPNPCYAAEAHWAGSNLSAYIYVDGLPSPAPAQSLSGPAGQCAVTNLACASFNYGYFWARHWVAYSRSEHVDPRLWWLDVEKYSGWQDTTSNQLVINGAIQGIESMGAKPGIYSTQAQWQEITGGMAEPGLPLWTPGAGNQAGAGYTATSFCAAPGTYGFAGGELRMVQFGYQGPFPGSYSGPATPYDMDYACG